MIDLSWWPAWARLGLLLAPFLIGLTGLAIVLHIAGSRHFEVMCESLKRSPGLHEELKNGGAFTLKFRLQTVSAMTAGMIWPALGIRQGWLNAQDSENFPPYLRRRMKLGMYCVLAAFGCMAFFALLVGFKSV
ncbi:hypothetical protein [Pseudomonas sp. NPDC089406]|uniref:hypothetical protein n=1 Tax=Pseudomonas sp. NPDC089406 TaxID=3364463 RepID=UPI00384C0207